jgi:hypothetical protein
MGNELKKIQDENPHVAYAFQGPKIPKGNGEKTPMVYDPAMGIFSVDICTKNVNACNPNRMIGVDVASSTQPYVRYKQILELYSRALTHFQINHHDNYEQMLESSTFYTDDKVIAMLHDDLKMNIVEVESDIFYLTKYVWTTAMQYPGMDGMVSRDIRITDRVLYLLNMRSHVTKLFDLIYDAKQAYLNCVRGKSTHQDENICAVLTCWTPVMFDSVRMNSFYYCDEHRGIAIFNGLRHYSNKSRMWNVLGLKYTGKDSGHVHYLKSCLKVPVNDAACSTHNRKNIRIRFYKRSGIHFDFLDPDNWMTNASVNGCGHSYTVIPPRGTNKRPLVYQTNDGNKWKTIPRNAFVLVNNDGRVDAWIQMRGWDFVTNTSRPIMDPKYIDYVCNTIPGGNPLLRDKPITVNNDPIPQWDRGTIGWGEREHTEFSDNTNVAEEWTIDDEYHGENYTNNTEDETANDDVDNGAYTNNTEEEGNTNDYENGEWYNDEATDKFYSLNWLDLFD